MKTNKKGIELIKEFEGLYLKTYKDIVGVNTIGYGHTGRLAMPYKTLTKEQCEKLLMEDLCDFEEGVYGLVDVPINENQFSALVSFAFNLGLGSLQKSTLLKLLNEERYHEAALQFPRWCKAGGKAVPGLLRRREAEKDLFLLPV